MYLHNFGHTVEVHAPAKLNLFLEVLGKRADGFHDLETLMTTVDTFDTLRFTASRSESELEVSCRWAYGQQAIDQGTLGDLPQGPSNLVWRALDCLREAAGLEAGGRVELLKRIPSAAGLGGASSDAAAALLAANTAWDLNWSQDQLCEVAAEIGSDVPFFLVGGLAVCRGRGEQITPLPVDRQLHFVVVRPPEGISTAEAFSNCQVATEPRPVQDLLSAWQAGDRKSWAAAMMNRLQQVAEGLSPWIRRLAELFDRYRFLGHQMSGSGSSYFGVCHHGRQARRLAAVFRNLNVGHVLCTRSLSARPVYSS
jgi:4-diphosphocytidyl-2-C-methyl-D-erythritol kinase